MQFREIRHGTPDYDTTVRIRSRILRAPLGLAFSDDELAAERSDFHLAALIDDEIIACLVLTPVVDATNLLHLRQMAVEEGHRDRGIGTGLVRFAEAFSREKRFREIKLHARAHAAPFYEKLGYHQTGDPFVEVTVPHIEMRKQLGS